MNQLRSCGFRVQGLPRFGWIETVGAPHLAHMCVMFVNWCWRGLWQLYCNNHHLITVFIFNISFSGWGRNWNFLSADLHRLTQVTFRNVRRKSELSAHVVTYMYVYTWDPVWNWYTNTLEPGRPQHDRPAACRIAQQYSSATFVSLLLPKGKIRHVSKILFELFAFLRIAQVCNLLTLKLCKSRGVCVLG
jgi:hypothetical protein